MNIKIFRDKSDEGVQKKLLKMMRKPMAEALVKKSEFEAMGIRAKIVHSFNPDNSQYIIQVQPNHADVKKYKKRLEQLKKEVKNGSKH